MSKRRITPTVTAVLAIAAAAFGTIAAANHDEAADLREQVATLTAQRDEARATLDGQYDVLKAAKPKPTKAPELRLYEDGSWVMGDDSGCAPSALCDDAYQDSLIEHVPSGLATWSGFRVGEVILCPKGYEVSVDDAEDGSMVWAACM